MTWLKRLLAITLALVMFSSVAAAELVFLPQLKVWTAEDAPLRLTMGAEIKSEASSGEKRLEQLQLLMKHLSLQVDMQQLQDETWSRVSVLVGTDPAIALSMRETVDETLIQTNVLPNSTYRASSDMQDPLEMLAGGTVTDDVFAEMDFSGAAWLKDAEAMLTQLTEALAPYAKVQKVDTSIQNMGKAKKKTTFTIPADDAANLTSLLAPISGSGALNELVESLIFSGKQTFQLYQDNKDQILKLTYEGKCGLGEKSMRKASLSWSLRRNDTNTRDTFTLKTPAVSGNDRNNLTVTRIAQKNKNGSISFKLDAKLEVVDNKQKTSWVCDADLKAAEAKKNTRLTGTFALKHTAPDDTTKQLTLTPDVLLGDAETPMLDGKVNVKQTRGSNTVIEADLTVKLSEGEYFNWEMTDNSVDLEGLKKKKLTALREELVSGAATALVRHIALLPREDTLYLFDGLDEKTMEKIIEISRNALQEEEAQ